jgi:SAM-dependent methyltransferase
MKDTRRPARKNIVYKTENIVGYFKTNRVKWEQFYPSEKWIFERVAAAPGGFGKVLDAGCAAGGLGLALGERFPLKEYVGVDINAPAIALAQARAAQYACPARFLGGDILAADSLPAEAFDTVVSLSCADWNVATEDIIARCWRYLKVGGHLVLTLRLTPHASLLDISESFQYIYYGHDAVEGQKDLEKAAYMVLNINHALSMLAGLSSRPSHILAYGYWGPVSPTARTKYHRLVFTALAVCKGRGDLRDVPCELHLPADLFIEER